MPSEWCKPCGEQFIRLRSCDLGIDGQCIITTNEAKAKEEYGDVMSAAGQLLGIALSGLGYDPQQSRAMLHRNYFTIVR